MLTWQDIGKFYGRNRLFQGLSGELLSGNGLVVTGLNGSGKSTLLKVFAGLVQPDRGSVKRECRPQSIGYGAPDQFFYPELTAYENLQFACCVRGLKLTQSNLQDLFKSVELQKSIHKRVGTFSTGMIQRLRIATAYAIGKDLILLDEPTIGLDQNGRELVEGLIQNSSIDNSSGNRAIVIATNKESQLNRFLSLGWSHIHVGG